MHRRHFLQLATVAALATACGAQSQPPAVREKATIGLTYIPNVQFSPFYLAEDNQEFANRGLDVALRHHGANEGLFDALAQGREDFVLAGGDELLQARAKGLDLVAVSAYYRTFPGEVIARQGSGIATLADLRGKRLGVPGRYGETWFAALVALREARLSAADVEIVEIGYTAQAAMGAERVDAIVGFANNDAVQLKLAGLQVVEVGLGPDVPLVSASLVTSRQMLTARPVVVRSVVAAMLAGIKAAVQSPGAAVTATSSRQPGMDAAGLRSARATMDATVGLLAAPDGGVSGRLDQAQWSRMATFMAEAGLVEGTPRTGEALTNDYLP